MRPVVLATALLVAAAGCGKKAPPVDPATPTAPDGGAAAAADTSPATPAPLPAVATPRSLDELAKHVVDALVAKDTGRLAALLPSAGFLERHCPEMAPALRQGYVDRMAHAMTATRAGSPKCHELDWTGATLVSATIPDKSDVDFYGCGQVVEDAATITIEVGGDQRTVELATLRAHGDWFVTAPVRCTVPSPCAGIVARVEEILAATPTAPEKSPLSEDERSKATLACEMYWDMPDKRERLACLGRAKTHVALGLCGESLESLFLSWPRR
ncbi:MAG: hypothetical protein IT385_00190 [Deltaproteobacteria bacterium]|nr:hypothetical protein [Deltaproteobacteria bacterium]